MNETTKQSYEWSGEFGREYSDRNNMSSEEYDKLFFNNVGISITDINKKFLNKLKINNILEVGTNIGLQLINLYNLGYKNLYGVEIQKHAIDISKQLTLEKDIYIVKGTAFNIPYKTEFFDLVFTSGVLMHISPKDINKALDEIYRCSKKYIYGYEYFSENYIEVKYRENKGMMWKTNFMKLFLDRFPDLKVVQEKKYSYLSNPCKIDQVYLLKKR